MEAADEIEPELEEEERIQKLTKAQSALDAVLQLGEYSKDTTSWLEATVEKFKIPKIKNAPKSASSI